VESAIHTLLEAKETAERLKQALPEKVDAVQQGINHKIAFYMLVAREASIHRVSTLADDTFALLAAGRSLGASVLTRSMLETTAVLGFLLQALKKFEKTSDLEVLHKRVEKVIVGSKNGEKQDPSPVHVLAAIEAAEEFLPVPGLTRIYANLSEFAHPNWAGLMGSFAKHEDAFLVRLGGKSRAIPPLAPCLTIVLSSFEHLYAQLGEEIVRAAARMPNP